tara:strand:- start:713 stop:1030 length:318 start_codon:yes stop_codon:yes gene_type:complete
MQSEEYLITQSQASAKAGEDDVQWHLLAEAIPALSFAVAANKVDAIPVARNFNMMDMKEGGGSWPSSRTSTNLGGDWLHSDFRNVGLSYVLPMYEKMLEIGGLDQ